MCKITSKTFITLTSIIFWLAAAGLIFIGAWVYKEYSNYDLISQSLFTLVPATILMAGGVFFFLLGIIGCVGACKEQKCLLGLFFIVLMLVLVGMVTAAVLGYIKRADVEKAVTDGIDTGLKEYNKSEPWKQQIDFMQKELKCCGKQNYTDWFNVPYGKYPDSCCVNQTCQRNKMPDPNLHGVGCYALVKDQFMKHLAVVFGVASGFVAILVIGMIFSCVLICKRRADVPFIRLRNEPADGMRV